MENNKVDTSQITRDQRVFFRHTIRHLRYRQLELLFQWGTYPHVLGHSLIPVKQKQKKMENSYA